MNGIGRIYESGRLIFEGRFREKKKEGKGKEYAYVEVDPSSSFSKKSSSKKSKKKEVQRVLKFEGSYSANVREGRGILYINSAHSVHGDHLKGVWKNGEIFSIDMDELIIEDLPLIKVSDFKFDYSKDHIGHGSEGDIFRVEYEGRLVALKILRFDAEESRTGLGQLKQHRWVRSQKIWSKVSSHPFILELIAWTGVHENPKGYLTMLCKQSLAQSIRKNNLPNWTDKIRVLYEIAEGMKFLHEKSIMHRDLKPSNVLLDANNSVKICDLEFCRYDQSDWRSRCEASVLGSPIALAPEIVKTEDGSIDGYSKSCDAYSYGILVFCVFFSVVNPYSHMKKCPGCKKVLMDQRFPVHLHVSNCNLRPVLVKKYSEMCEERRMNYWVIDEVFIPCVFAKPKDRPSFEDIVKVFISNRDRKKQKEVELYHEISVVDGKSSINSGI